MDTGGGSGPFRTECESIEYMDKDQMARWRKGLSWNVNWRRKLNVDAVQLPVKQVVKDILKQHIFRSGIEHVEEFAGALAMYYTIAVFSRLKENPTLEDYVRCANTNSPAIMMEIDKRITEKVQQWMPELELSDDEIKEKCIRVLDGQKELLARLSRVIKALEIDKNREEARKPWSDIYSVYNDKYVYNSHGFCQLVIQGLFPKPVDRDVTKPPSVHEWLMELENTRICVEKGLNWMKTLSNRDMTDEERSRLSGQVEDDIKIIETTLADIINDDEELKALDKLYDMKASNRRVLKDLQKNRKNRDMDLVKAICRILMRPS